MTRGKRPLTLDDLTVDERLLIMAQDLRARLAYRRILGYVPTCAPLGASGIGRGELRTDVAQVAEATRLRQLRRTA